MFLTSNLEQNIIFFNFFFNIFFNFFFPTSFQLFLLVETSPPFLPSSGAVITRRGLCQKPAGERSEVAGAVITRRGLCQKPAGERSEVAGAVITRRGLP